MKEVNFVKTQGVSLFDESNTKYMDAVSGTFNLALGYTHPKMVGMLQAQLEKVVHISSHHSKPQVQELHEKLQKHAPEGLTQGWYRDITGSTANEGAIKMAQKATGKTDIITHFLSHHGQTSLMTALSGNAFRREDLPENTTAHSLKVPEPNCRKCFYGASYPECGFTCVEKIQDYMEYGSNGSVAAMMVEPILANGGNIVPPDGYFQALQQFCKERDIALIVDEVHAGMGRAGEMFASTLFGMNPDIMTVGKGLGGIGIPAAAILMRPEYDVLNSYDHSFTSGGNALSLAAATATIDIMEEEKILDHVKGHEHVISDLLEDLKSSFPNICDVRGKGFMWGIEFEKEDCSADSDMVNAVIETAFDNQQLILRGTRYGYGNVIEFRPSLVATKDELGEMVHRLREAIEDTLKLDPSFRYKKQAFQAANANDLNSGVA